ncbi:hypothetical protein O4J56_31885 [Nocardiopsis sp. RSe5-2]|uniref:ABC transporter n=1 Tax=Nocardiopsis endophytica TaxID=3018445 RepID=A0ABT4UEV7_9ACTN|nr:hypothetical protein [Nocardiopsis endophytica]MDA2815286.1 hypothetical protein [Nocardiopsis endophytica]
MTIRTRTLPALACAAGALALAGCGPEGGAAGDTPAESPAQPHGYVEGAEETAEPQWRLVLADTGDGAVHLLDPATEEVSPLGTVPGAQHAATDGRHAYISADGSVTVLDSGTWTVDHGDHVHYYRAEPGTVGETEAEGAPGVTGDAAVSVLSTGDGAPVLDRSALDEGEVEQVARPDGAAVVPYAGRLLAVGADGDAVQVLDRGGDTEDTLDETCPDPSGQAVTRRGAVLGCSDGALVVTEDDGSDEDEGALTAEKAPYPDGEDAPPAESFHHRPGAPVLAGLAADGEGAWVLDVGSAEWTRIDSGPAVAVSAAGEGLPVLVLGEDGTLRAYDPATGERTAERELMDPVEGDGPPPSVWIDTARAYVNDPAADAVHEIDYNDDLRVARTFDLEFSPDLMVETGS